MSERFIEVVEQETAEEKAGALGRTGRQLEQVLALYLDHEAACADSGARESTRRERLLWDLAERLEAFIVQREACGLRDSRHVLEHYDLPREAVARVGARRPGTRSR